MSITMDEIQKMMEEKVETRLSRLEAQGRATEEILREIDQARVGVRGHLKIHSKRLDRHDEVLGASHSKGNELQNTTAFRIGEIEDFLRVVMEDDLFVRWNKKIANLEHTLKTITEGDLIPHTVTQVKRLSDRDKIKDQLYSEIVSVVDSQIENFEKNFRKIYRELHDLQEKNKGRLQDGHNMGKRMDDFDSHRDAVAVGQARQEDRIAGIDGVVENNARRLHNLIMAVEGFAQKGEAMDTRLSNLIDEHTGMVHYTGFDEFMSNVDRAEPQHFGPYDDISIEEREKIGKPFSNLMKDWPPERKDRVKEAADLVMEDMVKLGTGLLRTQHVPIEDTLKEPEPTMSELIEKGIARGRDGVALESAIHPGTLERVSIDIDERVVSMPKVEIYNSADDIVAAGRSYPDGHMVLTWLDGEHPRTERYDDMQDLGDRVTGNIQQKVIIYLD